MTNKTTANELRSLVAELKPRSPEEIMGSAASSNLMRSMSTATLASVVLLVAATTVMLAAGFGPSDSAVTPQVNESESVQADTASDTASDTAQDTATKDKTTTESTAVASSSETTGEASSTESAIDAMGIGDAAAPDSEPESLENRLDKILDGLE